MKKLVVMFVLAGLSISASAGIMIHPKFVFFDDKTKVAEVSLINPDSVESSNYRISVSYKKQNPDGSYTEIPSVEGQEEPADSAVPLLRYSPRSVLLAPQKGQVVRILKRLPPSIEPGDYVAYITFTEVLMEKPLTKQEKKNTFSVTLTAIPAFSIPVVVRHQNKANPKVSLENFKQETKDSKPYLSFRISKEAGKKDFVRGDISIWMKDEMIGLIRGKYLLPSTDYVDMSVPLNSENKALTWDNLKGKKIKVLFTEPSEDKINKKNVLAKQEVKF